MDDLSLFLFIATAHVLAVMSPGPDFAMVTRQTLAHGRAAGVRTAVGIGAGICFHVGWGLFGLGWVIARVPVLLEVLRWGGALFLLWMGSQALRAQPQVLAAPVDQAAAGARDFGIGFLTNLLNPKVMMFFIALCSAVITSATPMGVRLAIGAWIVGTTIAWFSLVSFTLGLPVVRQRLRAWAHWIDRGMGAVLVVLALVMMVGALRA